MSIIGVIIGIYVVYSVTRLDRYICGRFFFFFNATATTEIYTLSLHDALPICHRGDPVVLLHGWPQTWYEWRHVMPALAKNYTDRKSTRLNSSHVSISYAVFCLKKKTTNSIISTSCLLMTSSDCKEPISRCIRT